MQNLRNSFTLNPQSEVMSGFIMIGGWIAILVGIGMVIYWHAQIGPSADKDKAGRTALAAWQKSWLCNACGDTFEWQAPQK